VSFAVAQRTREIGVRIALGASPSMVVRTIVREALGLTAMGLGIGLGGALALTRVLESELFDVSPADPAAFARRELCPRCHGAVIEPCPGLAGGDYGSPSRASIRVSFRRRYFFSAARNPAVVRQWQEQLWYERRDTPVTCISDNVWAY
jgi:ABC-type antimicrobial peptide transport system permease subunit